MALNNLDFEHIIFGEMNTKREIVSFPLPKFLIATTILCLLAFIAFGYVVLIGVKLI